jgi:hypothetical protein
MKNNTISWLALGLFLGAACKMPDTNIRATDDGFELKQGLKLTIVLKTPLNCNLNKRGDTFSSSLKEALMFNNKPVIPAGAEIRGLVKDVSRYNKPGDRASLLLMFDQLVLLDGQNIPIEASLDTKQGAQAIKIKGQAMEDAKMVGSGAITGALAGKMVLDDKGLEKGIVIGAAVGAGAALLSNAKEVTLPEGTEITIKLDQTIWIKNNHAE